jgi:uncharacterized protein (UPF0335 family)
MVAKTKIRDPETPPGRGHNHSPAGFAADQLKSFVERLERLAEEKQTIQDDMKDVFAEAKGSGFDVKQIRKVLQIRKMDKDKREEDEAVLELYLQALGMVFPTPDEEDSDLI